MELTCSFENSIDSANLRKSTIYLVLKTDIEEAGWNTSLVPFEIGPRGQITDRKKKYLFGICKKKIS